MSVDGRVELRVGRLIADTSDIVVTEKSLPVSRAGIKLEKALDAFGIESLAGVVALDLGAATGGFTQILLRRGADLVVSVDVGTNQLARELRTDPRVISLEATDARTLTGRGVGQMIAERLGRVAEVSLITVDLSFISLGYLLPMLHREFLAAPAILLFKPQFEVGRGGLGKNGVVKNGDLVRSAIESFLAKLESLGGSLLGAIESPILGLHGNRELLLWITMQTQSNQAELTAKPAEELGKLLDGWSA